MKTAKFGGTSLADAGRFLQVRDIILSDPEIRFVVVSAPGKRFKEDKKITDLLYACHDSVRHGVDAKHAFRQVADRFRQIVKELGLKIDLESEFKNVESDLEAGASIDYCASRGEYFSALIMSALLQWPLIDPAQCLFFDHNGGANLHMADRELKRVIGESSCGVMPGFYGAMAGGGVRTFARGGSDISGALLANASGSDVYENWTDVPGIFNGDPSTVPDADVIPAMAYEEIRELAYMGANVLHEDAVFPARRMG
ncbi:MAG: aspartate kinase, partial [Clostridia bacterium]|nr:aspartate kinase [Clostridia bacterium]